MSGEGYFVVPFRRNTHFVGRSDDLERLHEALQKNGAAGIVPAGLSGMGGIGKTQLAVEYVYRCRDEGLYPDGIFWPKATGSLQEAFAELGELFQEGRAGVEYQNRSWIELPVICLANRSHISKQGGPLRSKLRRLKRPLPGTQLWCGRWRSRRTGSGRCRLLLTGR